MGHEAIRVQFFKLVYIFGPGLHLSPCSSLWVRSKLPERERERDTDRNSSSHQNEEIKLEKKRKIKFFDRFRSWNGSNRTSKDVTNSFERTLFFFFLFIFLSTPFHSSSLSPQNYQGTQLISSFLHLLPSISLIKFKIRFPISL